MRKKHLAMLLDSLEDFKLQNPNLEQWKTPGDIAADILLRLDFSGKVVADLGCGTGVFGIGALILGAKKAIFVDIDEEAFVALKRNLSKLELLDKAEVLKADVLKDPLPEVDLVVMNPPFGAVKRGVDVAFVKRALEIAKEVYSLHSLRSREYLEAFGGKLLATYRFPLRRKLWFHKKKVYYMDVGLFQFHR